MTKHEWSERTAVEWRSPNEELILVLVLMLVIDSEVRQTADLGALKITSSLSESADPSSQGAAAAPIWPSLPYRAGTRRTPVRAPTPT